MNRRRQLIPVVRAMIVGPAFMVFFITPVQGQFTGDSQTNIISGVISNWSGGYYIGNGQSLEGFARGHVS